MAKKRPRPSVLIIGSEALPFAKTGGLADVLGALPPALARLGGAVTVARPKYPGGVVGERVDAFPMTVGGYTADIGFDQAPMSEGARAILIDAPELFDRDGYYQPNTPVNDADAENDFWDNPRRFAVLARAALDFVSRSGRRPSVVHAHDW